MCKWFITILMIVLWSVYFSIVHMQHGMQMFTLCKDSTMEMKRKLFIDCNFRPHMSIGVLPSRGVEGFPQIAKFRSKVEKSNMIIFMCINLYCSSPSFSFSLFQL